MSSELKSCPFCGGEAWESRRLGEDLSSHNMVNWSMVRCRNCDATTGDLPVDCDPNSVDLWNTRHIEEPKLPRVSPGELKEGEWYVVIDEGVKRICQFAAECMLYTSSPHESGDYARFYDRADDMFGPLPHFELGE